MPHKSPLHSVHSLRCDEGSLSLNELMVLCTSLSKKVSSLESELKHTKETYITALIKLILRVKKLEKQVQATNSRTKTKLVLSEDEDAAEDPSNQGRIIEEIDANTDIKRLLNKEEVLVLLKLTPEEEEMLVLVVVELVLPVNQT
ncbi:hypothetical protein Tco_0250117, partial [Tanacetum coccineum]